MDNFIGKLLAGKYEIVELIGIGGMAYVYKATDISTHVTVAVKVLKEEFVDNQEIVRRFYNESKVVQTLSHPNIVKVHDVVSDGGSQFIVMEYMDGISLKEYIEKVSVISWKEAVHFTIQILRALQHAHDRSVIHRDIKPQNIMLMGDGSIKVMDFGIARFSRGQNQTVTDKAIGSVHYISPEQARGDYVDERTDIYSVGVMLFEMVTGQLPFEADSPVSVAIKQIQSTPRLPSQINAHLPKGLEEIILKAMQKDPAMRYPSAVAMLTDLDQFRRDPRTVFHYSYGAEGDSGSTKAFEKVKREKQDVIVEYDDTKPKSAVVPILTGITTAFIMVALAFVGAMLWINNPFKVVQDVKLPNFIGSAFDTTQEQYNGKFVFVVENTEYNETYEKGVIFDQDPKPNRMVKENATVTVKVSRGPRTVTIPEFTGHDVVTVSSSLINMGLIPVEVQEYNPSVTENAVIRTSPISGTEVSVGTEVTLYVSMGDEKKTAKVPNVTNISIEDARRLLEKNKLQAGYPTYVRDDTPEGTVLEQDIPEGTEVDQGTAVNLTVSSGNQGETRVSIAVPLPTNITTPCELKAYLDGKLYATETLTPSTDKTWKPVFEASGEAKVLIRINGENYMYYSVNFDEAQHQVLRDYRENFTDEALNGGGDEEEDEEEEGKKLSLSSGD